MPGQSPALSPLKLGGELGKLLLECAVFAATASDGSCKSAVSSCLRYRATLSSICAKRRSIFARVKFLSRLLTFLNLLPMGSESIFTAPIPQPGRRPRRFPRAEVVALAAGEFQTNSKDLPGPRHCWIELFGNRPGHRLRSVPVGYFDFLLKFGAVKGRAAYRNHPIFLPLA